MDFLFAVKAEYLPDIIGGGVLDIHDLSNHLLRRGHQPSVLAATDPTRQDPDSSPRLSESLTRLAYPLEKVPSEKVTERLKEKIESKRPDVVLTQTSSAGELAAVALEADLPVIIRLITIKGAEALDSSRALFPRLAEGIRSGQVALVSNSEYVARRTQELFGVHSPFFYPLVDFAAVKASERNPERVTFINPIPEKGLEIALEVARLLPQHRFQFIRSWTLTSSQESDLTGQLRDLRNVTLAGPTWNMKEIYAKASVLLVPSRVPETFGRVAFEAAVNGIPQIVSNSAGLPEASGPGAVYMPLAAGPLEWADELERLLESPAQAEALGLAGREHSLDEAFSARSTGDGYIKLARDMLERSWRL